MDPYDELREVLRQPDRRSLRRHLRTSTSGEERSGRGRSWRAAAVVAGVATAVVGLAAVRPVRSSGGEAAADGVIDLAPSPASTTTTSSAVTARLWPAEPVEVVGREVRSGGHVWSVGDEGDVVAVGDWDCDGEPTPAVLRPSSGTVAVFDEWASDGAASVARAVAVVGGAGSLRSSGSCGEVVLELADGAMKVVPTGGEQP